MESILFINALESLMKKLTILFCLLWVAVLLRAQGSEESKYVNIVFIGNSITQGVIIENPRGNAPPAKAAEYLRKQPNITKVKFSNQGVSGMTTVDFLPATKTYFKKVVEAGDELSTDSFATLIFSISLGTNDSASKEPNGAPVSSEQYALNIQSITDELLRLYPKCLIIYHRPIWYSPNTQNAATYLQEGLDRLDTYLPELQGLVLAYGQSHPGQVFLGDTEAYDYFKENYQERLIPENGKSGMFYLHPNVAGAEELGNFWGKAIYRIIP